MSEDAKKLDRSDGNAAADAALAKAVATEAAAGCTVPEIAFGAVSEGESAPGVAKAAPVVLVGVTGCIAAYKSCEIIRGLQKAGVRAKVVMTEHACEFVGSTTFRALTREPVAVGLFDEPGDPIHHVSLAQECDLFLIAPCTANVMAKMAHGIADDLLTTTALATRAPIVLAPAMNVHMYEAAATQENFATLARRGVRFIEAGDGYLACGDVGKGRLADVDVIVRTVLDLLVEAGFAGDSGTGEGERHVVDGSAGEVAGVGKAAGEGAGEGVAGGAAGVGEDGSAVLDLAGKRVMVTAGPTEEPLDAVRCLTNRSSGKTGYAIARAARRCGAQVVLVSGPVALDAPEGVEVVRVQTAREMMAAAEKAFPDTDIAVFSAAVADMRPAEVAPRKLKKGRDDEALATIRLVANPDILATCGARKRSGQVVVGFAAETDDVLAHAKAKLASKNADLIVANDVSDGTAFGGDDNEVWLVSSDGAMGLPRMSKDSLAIEVLKAAAKTAARL